MDDDDDLTKDVASLRAILSESVPSSSFPVDIEKERSACSAVFELQICLDKNIAIQDLLNAKLREVELALAENEQKMMELERLVKMRKTVKKGILTIWRRMRNDYFKDHKGQAPPSLVAGNMSLDQLGGAAYCAGLTWLKNKMANPDLKLTEGVRRQIIDSLTQPLQASLMKTTDNEQKLQLRQQIKGISSQDIRQLVKENVTIDWVVLAYEQFNNSHTAADCELRWRGHTHPGINKAVWNKQEDKELIKIAKAHDFCNWIAIAAELGTNRTAFMCLQRYQQSLNPTMLTKAFTLDNDDSLREAVRIYGESRWGLVAAYVEGKTPSQCMQRYVNSLKPGIKKGRWSDKEDRILREAVRKCGVGNWASVAALVPCRTQAQVRERWVNHLDEKVSKTVWTEEEDRKLIEICQRYSSGPIPWSSVAKEMPKRTDNMCYIRWRSISDAPTIFKRFSEYYKQRETVMTNFVGRKRYRHTLGEDDIEDMVPEAAKEKLKSYGEKLEKKKSRSRTSICMPLPRVPSANSSGTSTSGACGVGAVTSVSNMRGSGTEDVHKKKGGSTNAVANSAIPSDTSDATQTTPYAFPQGKFLFLPPTPEPLDTTPVEESMSTASDPQPHSPSQSVTPSLTTPNQPPSVPCLPSPPPPPPTSPPPQLLSDQPRPFLDTTVHCPSRQSLQGVYTLPPPLPSTCLPTYLIPTGSFSTVAAGSSTQSPVTGKLPMSTGNRTVSIQHTSHRNHVIATVLPFRTEQTPFALSHLFPGQQSGGVRRATPLALQQTSHKPPPVLVEVLPSATHPSCSPLLSPPAQSSSNIGSSIGEAMHTLLQETTASEEGTQPHSTSPGSLPRDRAPSPNTETPLSDMSSRCGDYTLGGQTQENTGTFED